MNFIRLLVPATFDNYDEQAYISANPDIFKAIQSGAFERSAYKHFCKYGNKENRKQWLKCNLDELRAEKVKTLEPYLRSDMTLKKEGLKYNYLSEHLINISKISETENVSAHEYSSEVLSILEKYKHGIILDCGSGRRPVYYSHVVNFEIINYDTTDVLGIGEELPFKDNTFDAVLSLAVLEHVRDPFKCAKEITRVLKPGGELLFSASFMQPYHGYPHHYFNMTPSGARALFEDYLIIEDQTIPIYLHPIRSVSWILRVWLDGLPTELKEKFKSTSVNELLAPPAISKDLDIVKKLNITKSLEICAGTLVYAKKPPLEPL
ncbi:MAG: class I SAM-dependent methyltransferase [Gammaproteobacteria bacterium]|nr:class I SAM-dependent methyltransferase [Gammaproteobacteria bacterium]